ncbi:MAG: hemerythrin domain-containing protein [Terracidiphilus sp.]
MGIQIGAKPDSGFDDPLGMLKDCHRRIENFLRVLCVVAERARGRKMAEEEAEAIEAALHYFRVGGERHTADEEESLFPRLRAQGVDAATGCCQELESDHERANALHAEAETLYRRWMADGTLGAADEARLSKTTDELSRLYAAHIRVEEDVVFPHAAKVLDGAAVAQMGEEFRARRA